MTSCYFVFLFDTPGSTFERQMNMFDESFSKKKCTGKMEIYSRVVGFYRPTKLYNKGKQQEFSERKTFNISKLEFNDKYPFVYQFLARKFLDQSLNTSADAVPLPITINSLDIACNTLE